MSASHSTEINSESSSFLKKHEGKEILEKNSKFGEGKKKIEEKFAKMGRGIIAKQSKGVMEV